MDVDCIVIGGGPAGLTASIYLARYRRQVAVLDGGHSRAALIPETHNYPGFAQGIGGSDLLKELKHQAGGYGVALVDRQVDALEHNGGTFHASAVGGNISAPRVILATGLIDNCPTIDGLDPTANGRFVRYCPICDGYEASDRDICVLGGAEEAGGKALFLKTYSKSVTLLTPDGKRGGEKTYRSLADAGVLTPSAGVAA
jgi:thioredoxin reductase (NADPH)